MVPSRRSGRAAAAGLLATALLAGCGSTSGPPAPRPSSAADRQWIDNALRFVGTLDSDIVLSASGGADLESARRALRDESDIYSMLVAYTLFGGCHTALANVGTPAARDAHVVEMLTAACRRLEHASDLFTRAMSRHDPHALLTATSTALDTESLLVRAKLELNALRKR